MDNHPVIEAVVNQLKDSVDIEGVFAYGSLANQHRDAYSDVEIGIVALNTAAALGNLYKQRDDLLAAIGTPVEVAESARDQQTRFAADVATTPTARHWRDLLALLVAFVALALVVAVGIATPAESPPTGPFAAILLP